MTDEADSDSPSNSSSSSDPGAPDQGRAWYAQQWNALCEELGTSDPTEVMARVQTMRREMKRIQDTEQSEEEEGLVTISEVEEVFQEMNQKMEKLRERNATLVKRLEEEESETDSPFSDLHRQAEELLDTLDAATMEEAHEQAQKLNQRLEDLYREREQIAKAGFSEAEEAINEIEQLREEREQLREERNALQRERDRLEADCNQLEQQLETAEEASASSSSDLDDSLQDAALTMRDKIGVSTLPQATAFVQIAKQIHHRIQTRAAARSIDINEDPDDVVEILRSITTYLDELPDSETLPADVADTLGVRTAAEARTLADTIRRVGSQIVDRYGESVEFDTVDPDTDDASTLLHALADRLQAAPPPDAPPNGEGLPPEVGDILDVQSVEDARDLERLIADMSDRIEQLKEEHATLEDAGLTAEEALAMIENMEAQLADLYHGSGAEQTDPADAADRLAAVEDVLGISTREEAEELSRIARQMGTQLSVLHEEKEKLQELGLSTIEDAVDMITNMKEQLDELYEDKESLLDVERGGTEEQSTFQQPEALYAEREKMQQAFGLSSAEAIIEMIESLNTQLNELYKGRDAEVDPDERRDVLFWNPDTPEPRSEEGGGVASEEASEDLTMNSMEHQLESLYREKETLLRHGFGDAQEAVSQLQTQQKQIDALQRENHTYEQRFERLESEFGTAQVAQIVNVVEELESEAGASRRDFLDLPSGTGDTTEYGLDIEAASPFVNDETLDALDEMDSSELNALDVGAVCLSDDGTVQTLNEAAFQLPGLPAAKDREAVVGKNFFRELAPSTNNNLFYGRFQNGQRRGQMDARFPYTFTSPDEKPQSFAVHLYRAPESESTWLLYHPT